MVDQKKDAIIGLSLMTGFTLILVLLFLPIIENKTPITYLDDLYNSISKGSVYYIPSLGDEAKKYEQTQIDVSFAILNNKQIDQIGKLLTSSKMEYSISENTIRLQGSLSSLIQSALQDADDMFKNKGDLIQQRYDSYERDVIFNWWTVFNEIESALTKQEMFKEANFVATVSKKAIECSYNYYQIEPQNIADRSLLVVASLAFYVLYTLWFGFAVMHLFKGLGLRLEH